MYKKALVRRFNLKKKIDGWKILIEKLEKIGDDMTEKEKKQLAETHVFMGKGVMRLAKAEEQVKKTNVKYKAWKLKRAFEKKKRLEEARKKYAAKQAAIK